MDKMDVLRRCAVFRDLNEVQLAETAEMCTPEVFEAGTILCKQGCEEERFYVVEDGVVGIILEVGPLAQRQVQTVSDFEAFGWSAILEPHICTATVKATKKTRVLAFSGAELHNLCVTKPEIGCRISRGVAYIVARRLREAYTQLLGVTHQY